jgi:hypothetical protein
MSAQARTNSIMLLSVKQLFTEGVVFTKTIVQLLKGGSDKRIWGASLTEWKGQAGAYMKSPAS